MHIPVQKLRTLGKQIQRLRKRRNLSIRALAGLASMDKNQLLEIERGEVNPRYLTICALAEAMCVPLSELVGADPGLDSHGEGEKE